MKQIKLVESWAELKPGLDIAVILCRHCGKMHEGKLLRYVDDCIGFATDIPVCEPIRMPFIKPTFAIYPECVAIRQIYIRVDNVEDSNANTQEANKCAKNGTPSKILPVNG